MIEIGPPSSMNWTEFIQRMSRFRKNFLQGHRNSHRTKTWCMNWLHVMEWNSNRRWCHYSIVIYEQCNRRPQRRSDRFLSPSPWKACWQIITLNFDHRFLLINLETMWSLNLFLKTMTNALWDDLSIALNFKMVNAKNTSQKDLPVSTSIATYITSFMTVAVRSLDSLVGSFIGPWVR